MPLPGGWVPVAMGRTQQSTGAGQVLAMLECAAGQLATRRRKTGWRCSPLKQTADTVYPPIRVSFNVYASSIGMHVAFSSLLM